MVTHDYASRRDEVLRRARQVVREDPIRFTQAGCRLDEIYSNELVRRSKNDPIEPVEKYAVEENPEFLRFNRLVAAVNCFRFPETHEYNNHLDFLSTANIEDRQLAARMSILVMLAAADPDNDEVVTEQFGVIASIPYQIREIVEGEEQLAFGGSEWVVWTEDGWDEKNDPSPKIFKRLRQAIDIVVHGSSEAARRSRIPSGDGRPCDHLGKNKFDEAERALRDVARYVGYFYHCVEYWGKESEYRHEEDTLLKMNEVKLDNRTWWGKWAGVKTRARDAIRAIDLSELAGSKQKAFDALANIADQYQDPLIYHEFEQPGDHLFRDTQILRDDDHYIKQHSLLVDALNNLDPMRRGCLMLLDEPDSCDESPQNIQTQSQTKKKRRAPRTEEEIELDELRILNYFQKNHDATRDKASEDLKIPQATISKSNAWSTLKARRKQVRKMMRPTRNTNMIEDAVIVSE